MFKDTTSRVFAVIIAILIAVFAFVFGGDEAPPVEPTPTEIPDGTIPEPTETDTPEPEPTDTPVSPVQTP